MSMMTRSANDIEDVLAFSNAVEAVGGTFFQITVEGQDKYERALQPHNTYRIWAVVPDERMDEVDKRANKERYPDDEEAQAATW